MTDAHDLLIRAIRDLAPEAAMATHGSRDWASATFVGMCHRMSLMMDAAEADRLSRLLPDHEFPLRDHFVADILVAGRRVEGCGVRLDIAALTIELH